MVVFAGCEYERRLFDNGQVFVPAGSGPCLQCRCKVSAERARAQTHTRPRTHCDLHAHLGRVFLRMAT